MKKIMIIIALIAVSHSIQAEEISDVSTGKQRDGSVSISLFAGSDVGQGLSDDLYMAVFSGELIEPPLGYEFLAIGMGDLLSLNEKIRVGSLTIVVNIVPIRARYLRWSLGAGFGLAAMEQVIPEKKFDSTGSQLIGQSSLTLFSSSLRVSLKALWIETHFIRDNVSILHEHQDLGSGIFYVAGLTIEVPL